MKMYILRGRTARAGLALVVAVGLLGVGVWAAPRAPLAGQQAAMNAAATGSQSASAPASPLQAGTAQLSGTANPGTDDYPWSPLCTHNDCGRGKVACDTNNCADPWGMSYGQCVSFVAWKIYEAHGGTQRPSQAQGTQNQNWWPSDPGVNGDPINGDWGTAANWATAAANAGKAPTQTPAVGDVAQWNAYSKGMGPSGHVMMVVAVSSGNYITVAGYNTHLDGSYGEWNIPWGDTGWSGAAPSAPPWPDNFLSI